jgi:hypothetical protein
MNRKLWAIFVILQTTGVSLASYSSRFEVGVGGVREHLWVPAMVALLPGVLLGYAAEALDVGNHLNRWHGAPFFLSVVLVNAACWSLVVLLSQMGRRPQKKV